MAISLEGDVDCTVEVYDEAVNSALVPIGRLWLLANAPWGRESDFLATRAEFAVKSALECISETDIRRIYYKLQGRYRDK